MKNTATFNPVPEVRHSLMMKNIEFSINLVTKAKIRFLKKRKSENLGVMEFHC